MRCFKADQVIAAIVRAAQHHAIAGLQQSLHRAFKRGLGQRGAVGIDEADRGKAAGQNVGGGAVQALTKPVATLRDECEVVRQEAVERFFVAYRCVADEAGCTAPCRDGRDVGRRVAQKARVQGGGLLQRQRWCQPCFHLTRARCLRHHGQGDAIAEVLVLFGQGEDGVRARQRHAPRQRHWAAVCRRRRSGSGPGAGVAHVPMAATASGPRTPRCPSFSPCAARRKARGRRT